MNKSIISLIFAIFIVTGLLAQTKPKPKPPVQSETDKMLEEAMKSEGMTEAEIAGLTLMMKADALNAGGNDKSRLPGFYKQ